MGCAADRPSTFPSETFDPSRAPLSEQTLLETPRAPSPTPSSTVPATASPRLTASPTGIASPSPAATLPPVPEAAPPAIPTATATWPAELNPFTGLPITPHRAAQRPLAIKISNFPPQVRPQRGLNAADIVFEHLTEGEVTRFTAIFYGEHGNQVGSIRSGRLIDLEIPIMYDAGFAYSGASGPVRLLFRDSEFFERIISPDFAHGGFERKPEVSEIFEHTLFTDTDTLRFLLTQRGENKPPILQNQMFFSLDPMVEGVPARTIEIPYGGTSVFWGYDGAGRYKRWNDGQPHFDAADETQLAFENIVVVYAHHQETGILEDNVGGGHYSVEIQLWGEGPAVIFRDGQRFDGRWLRMDPGDMLTFQDKSGGKMPLRPGRTFIQIVPLPFSELIVEP